MAGRYTFVEGVANPHSVTVLLKGQSDHVITQIRDAVRDGLRAVKNVFDDGCVLPGGCLLDAGCMLPDEQVVWSCRLYLWLVQLLMQ